jgi:hypothetical protein
VVLISRFAQKLCLKKIVYPEDGAIDSDTLELSKGSGRI